MGHVENKGYVGFCYHGIPDTKVRAWHVRVQNTAGGRVASDSNPLKCAENHADPKS